MAALLIGRFQPLHEGHKALVREALRRYGRVVVGLRRTKADADNPYTVEQRREMFRGAFLPEMANGTLRVIDLGADVTHVVHGRTPGWDVAEICLPPEVEAISATQIRKGAKA